MIDSFYGWFQGACLVAGALFLLWKHRTPEKFCAWFMLVLWWITSHAVQEATGDLVPIFELTILGLIIAYCLCKIAAWSRERWPVEMAAFVLIDMVWRFICEYGITLHSDLHLHIGAIPFYGCIIWLCFNKFIRGWTNAKLDTFRRKLEHRRFGFRASNERRE